jgi:hypothetical protein
VSRPSQPRDLLAERIRRLEARITELGDRIGRTGDHVDRAGQQLEALIGIVGRLGRVVDVQGDSLADDESHLERKVGVLETRLTELSRGVLALAARLENLEPWDDPPAPTRISRKTTGKPTSSGRRTKGKVASSARKKKAATPQKKKTAARTRKKAVARTGKKAVARTGKKAVVESPRTPTGKKTVRPRSKAKPGAPRAPKARSGSPAGRGAG